MISLRGVICNPTIISNLREKLKSRKSPAIRKVACFGAYVLRGENAVRESEIMVIARPFFHKAASVVALAARVSD